MFYLSQNRSWHLVPALVLVPTDPGLTGEKGLEAMPLFFIFNIYFSPIAATTKALSEFTRV